MIKCISWILFFSFAGILGSCSSYSIPIETENHPLSVDAEVIDIELAPILDVHEKRATYKDY